VNHIAIAMQDGGPSPGDLVPLFVPIASFGATIAIVAVVLFFRHRSQQTRQEIYRTFLEKGEPIPPQLLGARASRNTDLRRGMVLLAGGIGVSLALLLAHEGGLAGYGLIPAFIGIGFLVVWKVEARSGAEQDAAEKGSG
jgi:hypothetical protein